MRIFQHEMHGDDRRKAQIDHEILTEYDRADQRDRSKARYVQHRQASHRHPDIGRADQRAEPRAEDRQGEPAGTCAARKVSESTAKNSENSAPPTKPPTKPSAVAAGDDRRHEAADRADQHHALDAEIEDTGLLDDEFAGCPPAAAASR